MSVNDRPAIEGGRPVREDPLPYGRHLVLQDDLDHVSDVLRGEWLTTGPTVDRFEDALRSFVHAADVVAVSSGTAALHAACAAIHLGPGDEVILPALTFVASANAVLYTGATPVFAEVEPTSLVLDLDDVKHRLTPRTRAVMPVHFAGLPVDLRDLRGLASKHGFRIIEDAAHALGAGGPGGPVGSASDLATFSFHPVKHVTTGEGGAIATASIGDAAFIRQFRNHGLSADARARERSNTWITEMVTLGFNYRLSDIGAALGLNQLGRLPTLLERRRSLARRYMDAFAELASLRSQKVDAPDEHAWHIYPVMLDPDMIRVDRDHIIRALRAEGIGANLHYPPIHLHPYYRERFGFGRGDLPITERVTDQLMTLPLFPSMSARDQDDVITAVCRVLQFYQA